MHATRLCKSVVDKGYIGSNRYKSDPEHHQHKGMVANGTGNDDDAETDLMWSDVDVRHLCETSSPKHEAAANEEIESTCASVTMFNLPPTLTQAFAMECTQEAHKTDPLLLDSEQGTVCVSKRFHAVVNPDMEWPLDRQNPRRRISGLTMFYCDRNLCVNVLETLLREVFRDVPVVCIVPGKAEWLLQLLQRSALWDRMPCTKECTQVEFARYRIGSPESAASMQMF